MRRGRGGSQPVPCQYNGLKASDEEAATLNVTSVNGMVTRVNDICKKFSKVESLESYDIVGGKAWMGARGVWERGRGRVEGRGMWEEAAKTLQKLAKFRFFIESFGKSRLENLPNVRHQKCIFYLF